MGRTRVVCEEGGDDTKRAARLLDREVSGKVGGAEKGEGREEEEEDACERDVRTESAEEHDKREGEPSHQLR